MTAALPKPPMASLSLNVLPGVLIAHARELESFAETDLNLNPSGQERFWRASAALRAVAIIASDDPGLLAVICSGVDKQRRARS